MAGEITNNIQLEKRILICLLAGYKTRLIISVINDKNNTSQYAERCVCTIWPATIIPINTLKTKQIEQNIHTKIMCTVVFNNLNVLKA